MPTEVFMPKVDMDMSEGMISVWHATDGQRVKKSAPLFDIETDKASMEIESPASGILRLAGFPVGASIPIGRTIAWIYPDGEQPGELPEIQFDSADPLGAKKSDALIPADTGEPKSATNELQYGRPRASPLARRVARKNGIQLSELNGSGLRGRITRQDIDMAISERTRIVSDSAPSADQDIPTAATRYKAKTTAISEGVRRETVQHPSELGQLVPHLQLGCDVRLHKLLELRSKLNSLRSNRDAKLELVDFVLKASAVALQANPSVNAVQTDNAVQKLHGSDIALVVPASGGQLTPVIRNVERMTIKQLAAERMKLQFSAKFGGLRQEACAGGAAAVWDMSCTEVVEASASLAPPRRTMLSIGSVPNALRSDSNEIADASKSARLTLSADARAISAETGTAYLSAVKSLLESPVAILAF